MLLKQTSGDNMSEEFSASDITFKEMSEDQAVNTFQDDDYFDYEKRSMRYGPKLSKDSIWATAPARMFVAFYNNKPIGVAGFSSHGGALFGAGIHIREGFRKRDGYVGVGQTLVNKVVSEKGRKTLFINIANPKASKLYQNAGFKDMNKDELPEDVKEELEGITYADQFQKWLKYSTPEWQKVLKGW